MKKRKICVVLVDRANYGRMWPVMREIDSHLELELFTICAGTMLLERFGQAEHIVAKDGFEVHGRVYMELEGSVPSTMAKSVGFGIVEFSSEFQRLRPDVVLLIGDRYEALSATLAAAFQNIPIAHVQGGEISGSIDESTRHAITKFAQIHFPATERSAQYIINMGENPDYVFNFGCPCGDYIIPLDTDLPEDIFQRNGIGANVVPAKPFLLVVFHPVTTSFGEELGQVEELIQALDTLSVPTVWLWPNIDAGSDHISKLLRQYRERSGDKWLRLIKNFEPIVFQKILKASVCAVGNSSSFIRDTTFSGTPVVLIGDRQEGREISNNVIKTRADAKEIESAIRRQLSNGRYSPSSLYGNGSASKKIADTLASVDVYIQKRLHYYQR